MTQLKHFGILGMKWGRRKAGTKSTIGSRFDASLKQKYGVTRAEIKKNAGDHFDRSLRQKYGTDRATIQAKTKNLIDAGKKKYNSLSENKKTGIKLVGLFAGTTVATIGLIKASQASVNLIQKMDNLLYDDAIQGIANAIIDLHKK